MGIMRSKIAWFYFAIARIYLISSAGDNSFDEVGEKRIAKDSRMQVRDSVKRRRILGSLV